MWPGIGERPLMGLPFSIPSNYIDKSGFTVYLQYLNFFWLPKTELTWNYVDQVASSLLKFTCFSLFSDGIKGISFYLAYLQCINEF